MELNQIINGDLIIYCTQNGLNELEQTMINPESDDLMTLLKQGKNLTPEYAEKSVWGISMLISRTKGHYKRKNAYFSRESLKKAE